MRQKTLQHEKQERLHKLVRTWEPLIQSKPFACKKMCSLWSRLLGIAREAVFLGSPPFPYPPA